MTTKRDPDAILAAWLDEGPTDLPDVTRRAILTALPTTSQARRGRFAPWRFAQMKGYSRLAAAAVVAIVAVGGAVYLFLPRSHVGPPSPTPTASPISSTTSGPTSFSSSTFAVPFSISLADGWRLDTDEPGIVGLSQASSGTGVVLMNLATMTVRGPTPSAAWVPWPDDPYAWFDGRPEFTPVATRNTTVNGRPAVLFDVVTVPDQIDDNGDWVKFAAGAANGMNLKGPKPEHMRLVIVSTGPKSGIVALVGAADADYVEVFASFDRLLATLVIE